MSAEVTHHRGRQLGRQLVGRGTHYDPTHTTRGSVRLALAALTSAPGTFFDRLGWALAELEDRRGRHPIWTVLLRVHARLDAPALDVDWDAVGERIDALAARVLHLTSPGGRWIPSARRCVTPREARALGVRPFCPLAGQEPCSRCSS